MATLSQSYFHFIASSVRKALDVYIEMATFMVAYFFPAKKPAIPSIEDKILLTPAVKLSEQIKSGTLTSEEVVTAFINQIEKVNPVINAVVSERFQRAIEDARKIDKALVEARNGAVDKSHLLKLPLIGVPMTVKETIMLEGSPFTAGLPKRNSKKAVKSNPAVRQLIASGIIPIGSTNTPCMNMWWDSDNMLYGRTLNPYDLSRIVGGSTGGEAAILAASGSVLGVGSDLGGSIRIPANFCGVFGHKPTPFSVSTEGLFPAMRPHVEVMRSVGPMTRYAADLEPMLKAMVQEGEAIKMRLDEPVDLKQIKLFYCDDLGDPLVSKCDSYVLSGLRAAVEHLSSNFNIPTQKVQLEEFKGGLFMWSAEMSGEEGILYSSEHEDGIEYINPLLEVAKKLVGNSEYTFNAIVTATLERFSPKHGSSRHKRLTKDAASLRDRFLELLGDNGVLLMPTHPQPAPHHLTTIFKFLNCSWTALVNVLHCPATQCPMGTTSKGLPYGLQVLSKPYNDRVTLAVARELEKAFGGWQSPSRAVLA